MSAQDWYARRLGQQAPQQRPTQPTHRPEPVQRYPSQQGYQGQPEQYQQPSPEMEKVTVVNLWHAMQHWRGGPAARIDRDPCPQCGSSRYYSRVVDKRLPPPAPHCFDCGFNGMYEQGLQSTWGA